MFKIMLAHDNFWSNGSFNTDEPCYEHPNYNRFVARFEMMINNQTHTIQWLITCRLRKGAKYQPGATFPHFSLKQLDTRNAVLSIIWK